VPLRSDLVVSVGGKRTLRANQITVARFVKKSNLLTNRALRWGITEEFREEYQSEYGYEGTERAERNESNHRVYYSLHSIPSKLKVLNSRHSTG
jgi:hypothetical protein